MRSLFGLIIFVLDVYALYHVITSNASTGKKVLWSLAILILPVLGLIVWYFAGPRSSRS